MRVTRQLDGALPGPRTVFKEEASEECLVLITSNILFFSQYVFDFNKFCFQYCKP
jgi:hypothetical protein